MMISAPASKSLLRVLPFIRQVGAAGAALSTVRNNDRNNSPAAHNPPHEATPYRDNASDILPLRVSVTSPNRKQQLIQVAKGLCPFLRQCATPEVTRLGGGLSNELFIIKSDDSRKSVLVRIHPSNNSNLPCIVDRNLENAVSAWLSSQGVGPTYYGRFQNGRVEEFYPHHLPLSWKAMSRDGPSDVAPIMANFHALQVPPSVLECNTEVGDIFRRVREWIELAERLCQSGQNEKASNLLATLKQSWHWLEQALLKETRINLTETQQLAIRFMSEIVFTHMDMQSLNLLKDTTGTDLEVIKLIDFEYAGFNPRGVDIANTFCEHCDMNNIRADYATEYPSEQVQTEFIQNYIRNLPPSPTLEHVDDPDFLEAAQHEIGRYALVSHLSWAIWSIVQAHMSDVDFDYLLYAEHRRDGFEFMKAKYFGA